MLSSWDMTNLAQPVLSDTLHFTNTSGLFLSRSNAFIKTYGDSPYSVVDVSDPENMMFLGAGPDLGYGNVDSVTGTTMYFRSQFSIDIYDVTDVLNPTLLLYIGIGPQSFISSTVFQETRFVVVSYQEFYHYNEVSYTIYNVANPSNPSIINMDYPGMSVSFLADSDHRMIMNTQGSFKFLDFTQPHLFGVPIGNASISKIAANDTHAFAFHGAISSHDLSDPFLPVQEGSINIPDLTAMQVSSNLLITSQCHYYDTNQEFYTQNIVTIYGISDPNNIQTLSSFNCHVGNYPSREIRISGTQLMLVSGYWGVTVYDISNPQFPALSLNFSDQTVHLSCVLEDGLLYSGVYNSNISGYELRVYDVVNSSPPALLSSIPVGFNINRIQKDGNLIYVGGQSQTIKIFDVSNPLLPIEYGCIPVGLNTNDFMIRGNALISVHNNSLSVYKIAYPLLARLIGRVNLNGNGNCLALSGNYALVGGSNFTALYDCSAAYQECSNPTPEQNPPVPAVAVSCYPNPVRDRMNITLELK
ncbi:MAG TPA: hypothetical protein PKI59_05365, partial [Candidatus Cloacimonadota bacterium]|nr:hypothetical protein [Candidatus Cloacimonadota bacterium]